MSELYLVMHIANGAPCYDIATLTTVADEDAWMVHGLRIYPYWSTPFYPEVEIPPVAMPNDWPWLYVGMNYPGSKHPTPKIDINTLFSPRPSEGIRRRL